MFSASGSNGTAHSDHRQYFGGEGPLSASATYLTATFEASTAVAMATATWRKHHCQEAQPC